MLGVCLRKLCPQDSFCYTFREERKSTPEAAKPAHGGPKWLPFRRLFLWPNLAAKASRKPCLGGSGGALGALLAARGVVLKPLGPLLGRPGPLLGASWGSFWDLPGVHLDDLDDVCGAT